MCAKLFRKSQAIWRSLLWPDEAVEAVDRLLRGPSDAAQKQDAVERVVEGPRIVSGDGYEDSP